MQKSGYKNQKGILFERMGRKGTDPHKRIAGLPKFFKAKPILSSGLFHLQGQTMKDERETKDELIEELVKLRTRAADLEKGELEKKYRTLIENANEVIVVVQDGVVKFVNPRTTELSGYSKEEIISRPFTEFIHPDDRGMIKENYLRRLKGEEVPRLYSFRFISKEGNIKWGEINAALIDWEGKPATLNFLTDITERKRREEKLMRLSNAVRMSTDSILISDLATNIIDVNEATLKMYGTEDKKDLIGKNSLDLIAPEEREKALANMKENLEKGYIKTREYHIITKDGSRIPVEINSAIMKDAKGRPMGFVAISRDITERKKTEKRLKESEEQLRNLVQTIPECIYSALPNGKILYMSPAVKDIFGYSAKEFQRDKNLWIERIHKDDQKELLVKLEKLLKKGIPYIHEFRMKRKDGNIVWIRDHANVTLDRKGKPLKIFGIICDISESKKAEEEKEKLQAQLLQSQKMEAIGTLAGGVAHDFNNILTAIQGYTDLAMMQVDEDGPLYQDLKHVVTSVTRAANLTKQLLAFSRKQPISLASTNLSQTVENLTNMLYRLIGEDITIKTNLEPNLWTVEADERQIEQVIMNLTVNAKDAMPQGGTLIIATENVYLDEEYTKIYADARPGRFVCLSAQDTGAGMDEETIKRIFEPFFTTKGRSLATGMGLSVVEGIVKQHSGWINVYSEPKKGSIFKIYLTASPHKQKGEAEKEESPLKSLQGTGEKILLVEDEEEVRSYLSRALRENGYQVREAEDAREALRAFEEEKEDFQLIFADVILPDRDALQLARELLSKKPNLSILFSSGYTNVKSHALLIKKKGFLFLQKPYSLADLLTTIRQALKRT